MQRQSLGSPSSKLQIHGGKEEKQDEEEKRKDVVVEDVEKKVEKLLSSTSRTDKSIHLIPILMLLCFLILYLVSYDPSQKDIANIDGLEGFFRPQDSTERGDFVRNKPLTILSHRSLHEVRKGDMEFHPSKHHRKFGFF